MVCPYCSSETGVINSRSQKRNNQVWRRRRCTHCQATFTTHEKLDESAAFLVRKNDQTEPFAPDVLFIEILGSLRDHERPYEAARELSSLITQQVLKNASNGLILSQTISLEAAKILKRFNKRAYLRFAAEHPSIQS